jgi:heme/copper-type cytochrome/quinol oxidase subunit 3
VIGIAFFFAIIGVFGLWVAIGGLALAILTAGVIIGRAPEEGDLS